MVQLLSTDINSGVKMCINEDEAWALVPLGHRANSGNTHRVIAAEDNRERTSVDNLPDVALGGSKRLLRIRQNYGRVTTIHGRESLDKIEVECCVI
jgi:hypothetical protein